MTAPSLQVNRNWNKNCKVSQQHHPYVKQARKTMSDEHNIQSQNSAAMHDKNANCDQQNSHSCDATQPTTFQDKLGRWHTFVTKQNKPKKEINTTAAAVQTGMNIKQNTQTKNGRKTSATCTATEPLEAAICPITSLTIYSRSSNIAIGSGPSPLTTSGAPGQAGK